MTTRGPLRGLSEARIRHLAKMREAKARKREERIAAGWTPEPKPGPRYYPLEVGFRDKASGETAWVDFRSVRQAAELATIMQRYWETTPKAFRKL